MHYSARTYTVLIQVSVESLLVPALLGAAVCVIAKHQCYDRQVSSAPTLTAKHTSI